MRTVKELSDLTGISVRTLHYYDQIELLTPTAKSEAGYRLYDDKALETLQQILFFREFDLPLKKIKAIMDDPALDQKQILQMQRDMLVAQKTRTERLIASIDDILKGENKMDFAIFNRAEIEEMFDNMYSQMPEHIRRIAIDEFGGAEKWRAHYVEMLSSEQMQKAYAKVIEWYGGKEAYQDAAKHPMSKEAAESYKRRTDTILRKLAAKRSCPIDSFEVKEIVGEYGFVMKQAAGIKKERDFMLAHADFYRKEPLQSRLDQEYGEGSAAFFADAIETFYQKSEEK
ncbi:MAG: MerR family transcriptional regulator [Lachnospiraceae bacterium]|nr:MerR family transcriptional regulator [Lachnospiraceae bacterium]